MLCHVCDPTFIGFCSSRQADCAAKTVPKAHAHEAVGVVALVDSLPTVVEYSEISKQMAEATGAGGELLYGAAHICVNCEHSRTQPRRRARLASPRHERSSGRGLHRAAALTRMRRRA